MNEEPNEIPEETEAPEERKPPTVVNRIVRIALGALAVYIIALFLTMFFWAGFPNPNGPALIATGLFVLIAIFLSISLTRPSA